MTKITPQVMQTKVNSISDTYAKLEQDIFVKLIELISIDTLNQDNGVSWQLEQLSKMDMLHKDVVGMVSEVTGIAEEQIVDLIQMSGQQIVVEVDQELQSVLKKKVKITPESQEIIDSIMNQTFRDLNNSVNQTLLTTNYQSNGVMRTYQEIVKQTMLEVSTGLKTPEQAFKQTVYNWVDQGIKTSLVDKGGHHWSLETYARMVINSTGHRVFNDLRLKRMEDYGLTTAVMSSHPAARQECAPIQGGIVNIKQRGAPNYDNRYPSIYDYGYGEPQGTQGINCSHTLTPFDPDTMTNPYRQYDVDEAMRKSNEQAKQRQLERSIRNNKKKLGAAKALGDEDGALKYKELVNNQQAKMREYLSDKPYLGRDYTREQVTSDLRASDSRLTNPQEHHDTVLHRIGNGEFGTTINPDKQAAHMASTHVPGKSYFSDDTDIQELLYKYAGTGKLRETQKGLSNVETILNVPVHGVINRKKYWN